MFDSSGFPKTLDEEIFDSWLEKGRQSRLSYAYLLVIWDELEEKYLPAYAEQRAQINDYEVYGRSTGRESLVAAYDLYSESRVS